MLLENTAVVHNFVLTSQRRIGADVGTVTHSSELIVFKMLRSELAKKTKISFSAYNTSLLIVVVHDLRVAPDQQGDGVGEFVPISGYSAETSGSVGMRFRRAKYGDLSLDTEFLAPPISSGC